MPELFNLDLHLLARKNEKGSLSKNKMCIDLDRIFLCQCFGELLH